MSSKPSHVAEKNLIFAGLGLQLGMLSKEQVIRAFTEWLFDKSKPLSEILLHQKAMTPEQASGLKLAVEAHIQKEGDEEKALATLHLVKDLESDLDHLDDMDLHASLDSALFQRKKLGLDDEYTKSRIADDAGKDSKFVFHGGSSHAKDRFERMHFLDSGNLGEVYFAKDTELNRTVVTKYIKPEKANDGFTQALFHLEGEVTGALEHPGIVPVYGLGKDTKGRLFYAMRYIRGRKLSRVIADYHAIPKSESGKRQEALIGLLQNFQSACLAVEYAHNKGVLHCDIKPDNIMIGDYGEVFVVDWGLVVVAGEVKGTSEIHQMETLDPGVIPPYRPSDLASSGLHEQQGGSRKSVGGTPAYMAPEQFTATMREDISLVTAKADIYALGSTLYHLLTGKAPHLPKGEGRESPDAFYFRITTGMIPPPREKDGSISKALEAIVLKAMEVEPVDRYASARELAEEVKRFVADEPLHAYQEGVVEKTQRFTRKNRALVTAASLGLVFIAFTGFGYGVIKNGYNEEITAEKNKLIDNQKNLNQTNLKLIASEDFALKNEQKALANLRISEKLLYINKIQRAYSDLNYGQCRNALEQMASIPFYERGWEYRYLSQLASFNHVNIASLIGLEKATYTPDGENIIFNCRDNTKVIKILNLNARKEIKTIKQNFDVSCFSISKDGNKIAATNEYSGVFVYDTKKNRETLQLKFEDKEFKARMLAFSPDGKILAGSDMVRIVVWDTLSGEVLLRIKDETKLFERTNVITSLEISIDGKYIIAGIQGGKIKVWDSSNGLKIQNLNKNNDFYDYLRYPSITSFRSHQNFIALSPDGKYLVSGVENGIIRLWKIMEGQEVYSIKGHNGDIKSICFSPDGRMFASGGEDNLIHLWNTTNGKRIKTLIGHERIPLNLSFHPDGKEIVSHDGQQIKLWDLEEGEKETESYQDNKENAVITKLSSDGKRIVSIDLHGKISVWSLDHNKILSEFLLERKNFLSISQDGMKVAFSENNNIFVCNFENGNTIKTFNGHAAKVTSCDFHPNGNLIASCSIDKTLRVWDIDKENEIFRINLSDEELKSVRYSSNGEKIIGIANSTIKIWDSTTKQVLKLFKNIAWNSLKIILSQDEKLIVTYPKLEESRAANSDKVEVWNPETGEKISDLKFYAGPVKNVSISPDGKRIATSSGNNEIKIWDIDGYELMTLKDNDLKITNVEFSRDGIKLICGRSDGTIKIWKTDDGLDFYNLNKDMLYEQENFFKELAGSASANKLYMYNEKNNKLAAINLNTLQIIKSQNGHLGKITVCKTNLNEDLIFTGSEDKTIKIWDGSNGNEISTLKGHSETVLSLAVNAAGDLIASGSVDNTIKLWRLNNEKGSETIKSYDCAITNAVVSPNGMFVAVSFVGDFGQDSNHVIKVLKIDDGKEIVSWKITPLLFDPFPVKLQFTPDNGKLIISHLHSGGKIFKIIDLNKEVNEKFFADNFQDFENQSIAISNSGAFIAYGDEENLKIIKTENYSEVLKIKKEDKYLGELTFSPDGEKLYEATWGSVLVRSTKNGKELQKFDLKSESIKKIKVSRDGKMLALLNWEASEDNDNLYGKITIIDSGTGNILQTIMNDDYLINFDFSQNGLYLVTGGEDKKLKLWSTQTGKLIKIIGHHNDRICDVLFIRDSKQVISVSIDNTFRIWDVSDCRLVKANKLHVLQIFKVFFDNNKNQGFWLDIDQIKKLWNFFGKSTASLTFSPGDEYIIPCHESEKQANFSIGTTHLNPVLIDLQIRAGQKILESEKLARWAKPSISWHLRKAKAAEKDFDWYGQIFHYKKLSDIDPTDKMYQLRCNLAKLEPKADEYFSRYQLACALAYDQKVNLKEDLTDSISLESNLIPIGEVQAGKKNIEIKNPFYIGKYEVTQEQWEAIMGNNPSDQKGSKLPVTNVSWNDCQEFIKKLNEKTKGNYRLPSGDEWEYACRAGTTTDFSFGEKLLPEHANFKESGLNKFTEVGSYKPNNFGLYDMHGNVFEYVADKTAGDGKGIRGGYFGDPENFVKSGHQNGGPNNVKFKGSGFRILKEVD